MTSPWINERKQAEEALGHVRFDPTYPGADDRSWMAASLAELEAEMLPIIVLLQPLIYG